MQFNILNGRPFSGGFIVYFISVSLRLIHFHVCVYEEKIIKKTTSLLFSSFFFAWILTLESDKIIPLYTSFNLNQ